MRVKWRNHLSEVRQLPGSGAMGATLGIWEYLSQTNNCADSIPVENRFKFVDDLTTLEIINLINIGMESYDFLSHVPSDIPTNAKFIDSTKLKSQQYLNDLNDWSEHQKMQINQKKTKAMIFNFTDNYQFATRLNLKNENIQLVDKMKILGTTVTTSLSWDDNCSEIITKVNNRMLLIRNLKTFGATTQELVHLWILYCRSVLEQSCVLWHSTLTQENDTDLERTQKTFAKLILGNRYNSYAEALVKLNLLPLSERRRQLCLNFATSGIENNTLGDLLRKNEKIHKMPTRKNEPYQVDFCNRERLRKSSVIYMQSLLNEP